MNICFSLAVPLNGVDQKTNDDKKKVEIIKTIEEVDNNNNEETMLVRIKVFTSDVITFQKLENMQKHFWPYQLANK